MKLSVQDQLKKGCRISYDDGRPGHHGAQATVLEILDHRMLVQFDDRADTTHIRFSDRLWMNFLKVVQ